MARIAILAPVKLLLPAVPLVTLAFVAVKSAAPEQVAKDTADKVETVDKAPKPQPIKPPPPPKKGPCDDGKCSAPRPK
jgi:hypothetical protein